MVQCNGIKGCSGVDCAHKKPHEAMTFDDGDKCTNFGPCYMVHGEPASVKCIAVKAKTGE